MQFVRNWYWLLCCIFFLFDVTVSEKILCGGGDITLMSGQKANVTCSIPMVNPQVTPDLPKGLEVTSTGIEGTPIEGSPFTVYSVHAENASGVFILGVIGGPTSITTGFKSQVVFLGLAIMPIHITGNTVFTSFSITPPTSGVISGLCTGEAATRTYQITGTNAFGSISSSFTLVMKAQAEANLPGLSACYAPYANGFELFPLEWYYSMDSTVCGTVNQVDLTDNFDATKEHTWSGLDDSIGSAFSAVLSGYLNIGKDARYNFTLTVRTAAMLFFDLSPTPLIRVEGETAYPRSATGSVHLSSGRHLLRLYYSNSGGSARLSLHYASQSAGLPDTVIDDTVTFVGGQAPSFLRANSITTVRNGVIKTPRMRATGSRVVDFSITPALPAGIHLNHETGIISGTSGTEIDEDFVVTASNALGSTETPIRLTIKGVPLSGLSSRYYRLETHQECQLERFAGENISLQVHTVDAKIDHPLAKRDSVWPGVPDDVFPRFFAHWSGLVFASTAGEYALQLRSRDGGRVRVAGKTVLSSWGCLKEVKEATGVAVVEAAGYVPIDVEYFASDNDFGAILSWREPRSSEFVVIPQTAFWHAPTTAFSYLFPRMHYYRGVPIRVNSPVFFGTSFVPQHFTIDPPLPAGLVLNQNGWISGTPSADAERTTHTVTATSASGTTCTTTLSIQVSFVAPPSTIHVTDGAGREVREVQASQFSPISSLFLSSLHARSWTIQPDLPKGISIGVDPIRVYGVPIVSLPQTVFTVTAANSGGSVSTTVVLSVRGCTEGKWFYSSISGRSAISFTLRRPDGEMVYENEAVAKGEYGMALCLPRGDYNYTMKCADETAARCYLTLVREDQIAFFSRYATSNHSIAGSFSTQITERPTLWVESPPPLLTAKQTVTLRFNTTALIRPVFAVPPLPDEFRIDEDRGTIVGSFARRGTYRYALVAQNDAGEARAEVVFHVETCPEDKGLIAFHRSYGNDDESVVVTNSAGEDVLSATFNNDRFKRVLCLTPGEYTVVMKTKRAGGSWAAGTELLVKDSWDDLLASTMLDNGKGEKTEYFTINYAIMDRLPMKFYNQAKAPASTWKNVDFDDSDWAEGNYQSFGNFTANTAYFRKEFSVDNKNKYTIFAFDLEILEGMITYINGQEVSRRNMNGGTVTHTTTAVSSYHALMWRRESVSSSVLRSGKNVLAVELHRQDEDSHAIVFDVYGSLLSSECVKLTEKGRATDSEHTPSEKFAPANAFDGSLRTLWRDTNLPVFLQYGYDYDRFEVVNKVVITAGNDYRKELPKQFAVLGMVDEDHGEVLTTVDNRNLFTESYDAVPILFQNAKAYRAYRVRVEEASDGGDAVSFAEMALYSCRLLYCPKQKGWAAARGGETVYGACSRGEFGEAKRSCELGVLEATWSAVDTSSCLKPVAPAKTAYIDFRYMVSNCTMYDFGRFVEARYVDILRDLLLVKKENVKLFSIRDCSDSETINVCFFVRVTTDLGVSKAVFNRMREVQEEMSYRMYTNPPPQMPEGMYFIVVTAPLLRTPGSKMGVAVVLGLVAIILIGTGMMVYAIRKRKGKTEKMSLL